MENNNTNNMGVGGVGSDPECGYKSGALPTCAPLATSWVPPQASAEPRYDSGDALTRGTLFPGLELPFMNTVNRSNPYAGTPLGELMALNFMINELRLYLDTHSDDEEAFGLLRETLSLEKEGRRRFVARYGPIKFSDLEDMESYKWLDNPWPWEYASRGEAN